MKEKDDNVVKWQEGVPHSALRTPHSKELERARTALAEAEAELAQEQAAVNAFRMHCRLMLDDLVDQLLELRSHKEALLVRTALLHQGIDSRFPDESDPLSETNWTPESAENEGPLLPTDTPPDKAAEKRLFRELARRFHPDLAASAFERSYRTTLMAAINTAYAAGNIEALYDLAGELSPEEADALARITDVEQRRTLQAISKMRRLQSKARRQLAALRQENTARLWQKAALLEDHDQDGWSVIRRELERAIDRLRAEITELEKQIELLNQRGDDR